jgi:general secretion pathway protein E
LSTLHTNSAVGAVTRLRDMGVEPFLLSSSLIGVLAQRLIRVLDPATRVAYAATPRELAAFGRPDAVGVVLYRPDDQQVGRTTGYRGRTGIYELVNVDEQFRRLIHEGAAEAELDRYARSRSRSITEDGWNKCIAGISSVDEVLRVTRED